MSRARTCLVASVCAVIAIAFGLKVSDPPGAQMKTFADSFLSSLDEKQKSVAVMPYDSEQRVGWHFIPKKTRKGLVMNDMNASQRTAALRLVRAALSEAGYTRANKIMLLENVLFELEGDKRNWDRDPNKYFVTIFGTPSATDPWGLSFEGHHLSLNFSCRDGRVVDSTPQFFAANPATIMSDVKGPLGKGTRVLRAEEDFAFELIESLTESQREKAMIADKAPSELRFAGEAQPAVGEPEGVSARTLSAENLEKLKQLVFTYTDAVAEPLAKERRDLIEKNGWENVYFAWAGATKPGVGHYYRVRGKNFLIEFVNTQPDAVGNPANHIHSVWRDVTGDFDLPNN